MCFSHSNGVIRMVVWRHRLFVKIIFVLCNRKWKGLKMNKWENVFYLQTSVSGLTFMLTMTSSSLAEVLLTFSLIFCLNVLHFTSKIWLQFFGSFLRPGWRTSQVAEFNSQTVSLSNLVALSTIFILSLSLYFSLTRHLPRLELNQPRDVFQIILNSSSNLFDSSLSLFIL